MALLAVEYFLFVFIAAVGVLQGAVNRSGLAGLSFFRRPWKAYLFSLMTVGLSFAGFFLREDRNYQGVEGLQQFALFSVAALAAVIFTVFLSSVLKGPGWRPCGEPPTGSC